MPLAIVQIRYWGLDYVHFYIHTHVFCMYNILIYISIYVPMYPYAQDQLRYLQKQLSGLSLHHCVARLFSSHLWNTLQNCLILLQSNSVALLLFFFPPIIMFSYIQFMKQSPWCWVFRWTISYTASKKIFRNLEKSSFELLSPWHPPYGFPQKRGLKLPDWNAGF